MGMKPCDLRPEHIAEVLGIPVGRLFAIAENTSRYYKPTRKTRKARVSGGKLREIDEPKPWFKAKLKKLQKFIQRSFRFHKAAHGSVRGRSCFTAANKHLGKSSVAIRDISDCFPSVTTDELKKRLLNLGFQTHTAFLLAKLLSHNNRIPQGSPTSNDAVNFLLYDLDKKATRACGRNASFTRVTDDIVMSSDSPEMITNLCELVEEEINAHGLRVNEKKRDKNGLMEMPQRQLVHSIVVNHSRGTKVNPANTATYTSIANRYVRAARCVSAESLEGVGKLRRKLSGYINYCRQAHFSPCKNLARLLRSGDRLVEKKRLQPPDRVSWRSLG